ncbi:hypothetical protein HDV62DRAFT_335762 [Trichoderma sp. SZMC 28011]
MRLLLLITEGARAGVCACCMRFWFWCLTVAVFTCISYAQVFFRLEYGEGMHVEDDGRLTSGWNGMRLCTLEMQVNFYGIK